MTVNGQWRICFAFRKGDAYAVEIVDYQEGLRACRRSHIRDAF
jgi:hypothetical protein